MVMTKSINDQFVAVEASRSIELGVEIIYSQVDLTDSQATASARKTLLDCKFQGDAIRQEEILDAADEVCRVVRISRSSDDGTEDLLDIFTSDQIISMKDRIHDYLGCSISGHLDSLKQPRGYPTYIGRLATYFWSSDDEITSSFGSFERRHVDPNDSARGPIERNSRELANLANQKILRQLKSFYQADFSVELTGPTKKVEGSKISWERGIAECQFLVLDYIRDQLSTARRTVSNQTPTMTIDDIRTNITSIVTGRKGLLKTAGEVSLILSEQLGYAIDNVAEYSLEVMHRGRMGALRFEREPEGARRAIQKVESLLMHIAAMSETRDDQAEIPILDL